MYHEFDTAVSKVLELLTVKHKSKQPFAVFKSASAALRKYLTDKDCPYSLENATEWLKDGEKKWTWTSFTGRRRTVFLIENCVRNKTITTWTQTFEKKTRFQCLPDWGRAIVEEYLSEFIHPGLQPKSIKSEKSTVTNFLTFITSQISSLEEITYGLLVTYFRQDIHKTLITKQVYNVATRRFLKFLENKQLIPEGIHHILEWVYFSYIIVVDDLPKDQKMKFQLFTSGKGPIKKTMSTKVFPTAMKILHSHFRENNYERTTWSVTIEVFTLLNQFMQVNNLAYSPQMAETWLGLLKNRLSKPRFRVFRRCLKLLESIMLTGGVGTGEYVYTPPAIERIPCWCRGLVENYIAERTREGKCPSTIRGDQYACIRFLGYMDWKGVSRIEDITPLLIMEFSTQDLHKTPSAKNCINGKIRNFIHFLAIQGMVPRSLVLAMTSTCASTVRIVKVLSPDQKQVIKAYVKHSTTPMELRNAAMISLGLNLGLRACDVINLRFSDVSLTDKTVSIIQQKTGVPVRLPLPIRIGNSIYRYIKEGRPQSDSPYVFVPHQKRSTRKRLKTCCACSRALSLALSNSGNEVVSSFHILRKTFASNLLAANNPVPIIASALGHSGIESVDPYLATDKGKMGSCPIGLSGIEFQGGRL